MGTGRQTDRQTDRQTHHTHSPPQTDQHPPAHGTPQHHTRDGTTHKHPREENTVNHNSQHTTNQPLNTKQHATQTELKHSQLILHLLTQLLPSPPYTKPTHTTTEQNKTHTYTHTH